MPYQCVKAFIIHCMCDYIRIRLTGMGENNWLLKILKIVVQLTGHGSQLYSWLWDYPLNCYLLVLYCRILGRKYARLWLHLTFGKTSPHLARYALWYRYCVNSMCMFCYGKGNWMKFIWRRKHLLHGRKTGGKQGENGSWISERSVIVDIGCGWKYGRPGDST